MSPHELNRNELAEALRRQARGAKEMSRSLGQTLTVTLHLPKKTLTPGALQQAKTPNRRRKEESGVVDNHAGTGWF